MYVSSLRDATLPSPQPEAVTLALCSAMEHEATSSLTPFDAQRSN
jgi:hypothetical protein